MCTCVCTCVRVCAWGLVARWGRQIPWGWWCELELEFWALSQETLSQRMLGTESRSFTRTLSAHKCRAISLAPFHSPTSPLVHLHLPVNLNLTYISARSSHACALGSHEASGYCAELGEHGAGRPGLNYGRFSPSFCTNKGPGSIGFQ